MKTMLTSRAQKLLSTLMEVRGPISRDELYILADLFPPTNGSLELALREIGGKGGIRTYTDLLVDGVLNPVDRSGKASGINGDSVITFVGIKDGFELDLSLSDTHPLEFTNKIKSAMERYREEVLARFSSIFSS